MLMGDPRITSVAIDMLPANDFYDPRNQMLFRILSSLYPKYPDLDPIAVNSHLKDSGMLDAVGGRDHLGKVMSNCPSPANIESYCNVVRKQATKRRLLDASRKIASIAMGPDEDVPMSIRALDALEDATEETFSEQPADLQGIAGPIIDDAMTKPEQDYWGIPTGIADGAFDELTGGIQPGQFWVIGSVPSMGKSTLIKSIAMGVGAQGQGEPLILSTEMTPSAIARFAIAEAAQIHTNALRRRNLTDSQKDRLAKVRDDSNMRGVKVLYAAGKTVGEVRIIARSHKRRFGLPLLIVDLASGLRADVEGGENQRIAAILRWLVAMKSELECCVVCCAHLNRLVTSNEGRRPQLANLRDSGEWEQHADRVLFIHREGYYDANKPNVTEIIQAKDREDGRIASAWIEWKKATGRYERANRPCTDGSEPPSY
jgi:replicative DNA helicase